MKRIDLTGRRFGRLLVQSYEKTVKGVCYWVCRCDCGGFKIIASSSLRYGLTNSCGCLSKEFTSTRSTIHGEARKTKEYKTWEGIKSRCYTQSDKRYYCYGARGIKVCARWKKSYEAFLMDMGRAPTKRYSIERINVNGDYSPSNCKWIELPDQSNNTTKTIWIDYQGRRMNLKQWASELKINYKTLHKYIRYKKYPFGFAVKKLAHST
jgi:hypothetical protein